MKRIFTTLVLVLVVAVAAAYGGYRFANEQPMSEPQQAHPNGANDTAGDASAATPKRKILFYKDPMGKPDFSPTPKKDEMAMDYLPVYEDEEASLEPSPSPGAGAHDHGAHSPSATPGERKILYYRNPMGHPDTSPVPKKDPMGMDYIPVYDGDDQDGGIVKVSPARVQMLGVRTEPAARRTLIRPVRAVGTVQFSERQRTVVSTKFEGWIEMLHVDTTGAPVRKGEPLMLVYSPLLVQTEHEYIDAAKMADSMAQSTDKDSRVSAERLVQGALQRLRYLDFPEAEIKRLQRERRASRTIAWPAPFSGIVLEKMAFEGMRFMPGEPLYRIAGISPIWVIAEIFEQDLAHVAVGQPATVTVKAYPGRSFTGRVAFIYPTVGQETRTGTVRIELPNLNGELKADMYAGVELEAHAGAPEVLTVPDSAVIDNGVRQVVLIDHGEGRFEPRPVRLGIRADGYSEIHDGVQAGERVVVSANFLIDAESNLKAALSSFTTGEHQP